MAVSTQNFNADFDPAAATKAYIDGLGPDALEKAAAYTMGNHLLLGAGLVVSALVTLALVRFGILQKLDRKFGPRSFIGVFSITFVTLLLGTLLSLPWDLYTDWWRETHYGRTSQPLTDHLSQSTLANGLGTVVGALFFVILYFLIRQAGRYWWLWGGAVTAALISLLLLLSPTYIEPLFNDFEPIPDGPVREAVLAMAAEANIPADRIFIYDGSRQSNNFTANVSGLGDAARIAISDVALGAASLDEVKAVTGHEVGHYVLGHVWRSVGVLSVLAMVMFFLADRTFGFFAGVFGARGTLADPSTLPVLLFVIGFFGVLAEPVTNTLTRIGETEADQYSLDTVGLPDALATALVKTAEYRNPRPARWQEILFYTHPSVERRVRRAMEWKAANLVTPSPDDETRGTVNQN
ncbi:MAG: M48 family metalloprotease [Pseudomonadota bacterium]